MPRVIVHRFSGDDIEDAELQALLKEAECEIVNDEAEDEQLDALIVVLTPTLLEDPSLENVLVKAVNAGQRIVCIWPKGVSTGNTPRSVEIYCSDQILWDPERLCQAIASDGEPHYDAPDGKPKPEPAFERNTC